jgi:hypothetical protein
MSNSYVHFDLLWTVGYLFEWHSVVIGLRQVEVRAMVWKEEDRDDYMVHCQRKVTIPPGFIYKTGGFRSPLQCLLSWAKAHLDQSCVLDPKRLIKYSEIIIAGNVTDTGY